MLLEGRSKLHIPEDEEMIKGGPERVPVTMTNPAPGACLHVWVKTGSQHHPPGNDVSGSLMCSGHGVTYSRATRHL